MRMAQPESSASQSKTEALTVLTVEPQSSMQTQLRAMLGKCGITRVVAAPSATQAARKLRESRFDIILCEANLGDQQDGQRFLEDIRQHHLIPLSTLFIMVTAERGHDRVVSTAELAPNDYILKPFTLETLQERLERSLNKREAFVESWRLAEAGKTLDAIAACEKGERKYPQYETDFLRLRAEMLSNIGQADEAQALYRRVLETRSIPWARLGLARMHFRLRRYEEALREFKALIDETPLFLDAYDWLARTYEAMGQLEAARDTLERAARLSPMVTRRLRRIGEVSLELGDGVAAEKVLSEVVRQTRFSDFRDPEDHMQLVRAQLESGATDRAEATLRELKRNLQGMPKTELCTALSSAMVLSRKGDARASEAAQQAVSLLDTKLDISVELKKALTQVCLAEKLDEQATSVVMDILRNTPDDAAVEGVKQMLEACGRQDLGEVLTGRLRQEVRQMMTEGAELAKRGDHAAAVTHMIEAVRRMPGHTLVLFNAALAHLKYIEHCGWDERYAAHARILIKRVQKQDPGNSRLVALHAYFDELERRHRGKGAAAQKPN